MTTHYSPPPRNQTPGASADRRSTPLWSAMLMSLVSAVIGGIIAVSLAAPDDSQVEQRLQPQLDALVRVSSKLMTDLADVKGRLVTFSDSGRRLTDLERRADGLASDIAALNSEVDGLGFSGVLMRIPGYRVDAPFGCSGRPAVWSNFGGGLGC